MFEVGFSELLLCFIVALVVLGPEKLPKLARTIGQWTGQARGYLRNLSAELDRESQLASLKQQLEETTQLVRDQQGAARKLLDEVTTESSELGRQLQAPFKEGATQLTSTPETATPAVSASAPADDAAKPPSAT